MGGALLVEREGEAFAECGGDFVPDPRRLLALLYRTSRDPEAGSSEHIPGATNEILELIWRCMQVNPVDCPGVHTNPISQSRARHRDLELPTK